MDNQINTIILALSTLVGAITPVLLAIINKRQEKENDIKIRQQEVLHQELIQKLDEKK